MKNCDTRYNSLRIKGLPPPQTKYQYSLKRLFGCTLCGLFGMDTLLRRHISLCGRAFLCLAFASLMMSCGDDDLPSPEGLKSSSEELVIFSPKICKVVAQTEVVRVPSKKNESGQTSKCTIRLRQLGSDYEEPLSTEIVN